MAATLAVTVFAFATGSSIFGRVLVYGRPARWVCLIALLGLAFGYAVAARGRRPPPVFVGSAAALVALALVSALWSVDPRLTLERGTGLAALMAIGACLVHAGRGRPAAVTRLLLGLLVGMVGVALAGLVVLAVAHRTAIQPATFEYPARYRGFEQNPNTAALLLALGTPFAMLFALEARSRLARAAGAAGAVLFAGSIAGSGSRGAMLGGLAGALVLVWARKSSRRRRLELAAVTVAVFAVCVGVSRIPEPKQGVSAPAATSAPARSPELGGERRTLFGSSGRIDAWRGAVDQAAERPVAGYGFGTEQLAFVDRFAGFVSDLPENSYIGAALQLGLTGLLLLCAAFALALAAFAQLLRRPPTSARPVAAACAGAAVSAAVLAMTQSYLFNVGNIATTSAWLSLFLLVAVSEAVDESGIGPTRRRRAGSSAL